MYLFLFLALDIWSGVVAGRKQSLPSTAGSFSVKPIPGTPQVLYSTPGHFPHSVTSPGNLYASQHPSPVHMSPGGFPQSSPGHLSSGYSSTPESPHPNKSPWRFSPRGFTGGDDHVTDSKSNTSGLAETKVTFNLTGSESSNSTEANSAESGFSEHKVSTEKTYASVCSSCRGNMSEQSTNPVRSRHRSDEGPQRRSQGLGHRSEPQEGGYNRGRGHRGRGHNETRHEGHWDRGKYSRRLSDRGGYVSDLKREGRQFRERSNSAGQGRGQFKRGNYERRPFSTGSRGSARGRPYRGGSNRKFNDDFQRSFSDPKARTDNLEVPGTERHVSSDVGSGARRHDGASYGEGGASDRSPGGGDTDGGPRGRTTRGRGGFPRRGSTSRGMTEG